jgi:Fe-S-cluster containining protein
MAKTPKIKPGSLADTQEMKNHRGDNACRRCGTCCTKGGPCFHHSDRPLIDNGVIHTRYLYTLRKGELAFDNVKACLVPVKSDTIKVKGKDATWTCVFFNEEKNECGIYHDRPLECRALKCWDTRELEALYAKERLSRQDLISGIEGLWELIKDHQLRCDYEKIHQLVRVLERNDDAQARRKLIEIIQYDMEIRKLVVAKGGLEADMLDFLFGRPLIKTIEGFGFRVKLHGKKSFCYPARKV